MGSFKRHDHFTVTGAARGFLPSGMNMIQYCDIDMDNKKSKQLFQLQHESRCGKLEYSYIVLYKYR